MPIKKKMWEEIVKDYRGVTIMSSLYKVYTTVIQVFRVYISKKWKTGKTYTGKDSKSNEAGMRNKEEKNLAKIGKKGRACF